MSTEEDECSILIAVCVGGGTEGDGCSIPIAVGAGAGAEGDGCSMPIDMRVGGGTEGGGCSIPIAVGAGEGPGLGTDVTSTQPGVAVGATKVGIDVGEEFAFVRTDAGVAAPVIGVWVIAAGGVSVGTTVDEVTVPD